MGVAISSIVDGVCICGHRDKLRDEPENQEQRLEEEQLKAAEATAAEEQRLKETQLNAEEERLAAEAAAREEQRLKEKEKRLAAKAVATQEQRLKEEQLKAEEERLAAEAVAEDQRQKEEQVKAAEKRLAAETAEEERLKEEPLKVEEERLATQIIVAENDDECDKANGKGPTRVQDQWKRVRKSVEINSKVLGCLNDVREKALEKEYEANDWTKARPMENDDVGNEEKDIETSGAQEKWSQVRKSVRMGSASSSHLNDIRGKALEKAYEDEDWTQTRALEAPN